MAKGLNDELKVAQCDLYTNLYELSQIHHGLLEISRLLETKREEIKEIQNMFDEVKKWDTDYSNAPY